MDRFETKNLARSGTFADFWHAALQRLRLRGQKK